MGRFKSVNEAGFSSNPAIFYLEFVLSTFEFHKYCMAVCFVVLNVMRE